MSYIKATNKRIVHGTFTPSTATHLLPSGLDNLEACWVSTRGIGGTGAGDHAMSFATPATVGQFVLSSRDVLGANASANFVPVDWMAIGT